MFYISSCKTLNMMYFFISGEFIVLAVNTYILRNDSIQQNYQAHPERTTINFMWHPKCATAICKKWWRYIDTGYFQGRNKQEKPCFTQVITYVLPVSLQTINSLLILILCFCQNVPLYRRQKPQLEWLETSTGNDAELYFSSFIFMFFKKCYLGDNVYSIEVSMQGLVLRMSISAY